MAIKNSVLFFSTALVILLFFGCTGQSTDTLQEKYDNLQTEHTALLSKYNDLDTTVKAKDASLAIVSENKTKLATDYETLKEKYDAAILNRDQCTSL